MAAAEAVLTKSQLLYFRSLLEQYQRSSDREVFQSIKSILVNNSVLATSLFGDTPLNFNTLLDPALLPPTHSPL